jgi:hypothetical protein
LKPRNGRAEGTPILFALILRGNSEILARLRALFFRQGGGSKSEARNLLCPKIQKEFLLHKYFWYTGYAHNIIN